ncbi:hypothetical protein LV779_31590 [Streptomyces thinghirensis]|nr:hypothetical protein [Streptomyces thinghirensis]
MAALLLGVDGEQVVQGQVDGLGLEERGLRAGLGGALWRVGRYRVAAQPGQGRRGRAWLPVPAFVAEQEGFGGLHVVAPLHPHPAASRRGAVSAVDRHTQRATSGLLRTASARPASPPHGSCGQPVGAEGGDLHAAVLGLGECPPVGHVASVAGGTDNNPSADDPSADRAPALSSQPSPCPGAVFSVSSVSR